MTYTQLALIAALYAVILDVALLRTRIFSRKAFWCAYGIVIFFQLLTNAWLTGRGIVRYTDSAIIGGEQPELFGNGRVAFAPVEDLIFGFSLVVQTMSWWVFWGRRSANSGSRPHSTT